MKCTRLIAFLLPLCFYARSKAQTVVLHNNTLPNVTYIGLANWLTVMAEGYSCDKLVLKPWTGRIETREGCSFIYYPDQPGTDIIRVFLKTKNGLKAIDSVQFHVKEIPQPIATVGGYRSGDSISVGAFKAQQGIGAYLNCCMISLKYTVTRYHLIIMKNENIIFDQVAKSNSFKEIHSGLLLLEPGQTILIGEILCVGEDGKNRNLAPLQYFMK